MTSVPDQAQMIDPGESLGEMLTHALHILPVALALVLPVVALGTAFLYLRAPRFADHHDDACWCWCRSSR